MHFLDCAKRLVSLNMIMIDDLQTISYLYILELFLT
jgi:hypothetical protein